MVIYGLVDPRDGLVYYIGSSNHLEREIRAFVYHARTGGSALVHGWIRELLDEDLAPELVVFEYADGDGWKEVKRALISEHSGINAGLLNITYNRQCYPVSDETKARIGDANRRRWKDPEFRRSMSEMMREKWKDPKMRKMYLECQGRARDEGLGIHYEE